MSRDVQNTKSIDLLPPGSYQATLYAIIDLGDQFSEQYDKRSRKIRFSFEIPSEMRTFKEGEEPKPKSVSKEYTLSFGERANLAKDLISWSGSGYDPEAESFNLESLIGKNCLLSITIEKGQKSEYNKIISISGIMKSMKPNMLINKPIVYRLDDGENEVFKSLHSSIQDKILRSKGFKEYVDNE